MHVCSHGLAPAGACAFHPFMPVGANALEPPLVVHVAAACCRWWARWCWRGRRRQRRGPGEGPMPVCMRMGRGRAGVLISAANFKFSRVCRSRSGFAMIRFLPPKLTHPSDSKRRGEMFSSDQLLPCSSPASSYRFVRPRVQPRRHHWQPVARPLPTRVRADGLKSQAAAQTRRPCRRSESARRHHRRRSRRRAGTGPTTGVGAAAPAGEGGGGT